MRANEPERDVLQPGGESEATQRLVVADVTPGGGTETYLLEMARLLNSLPGKTFFYFVQGPPSGELLEAFSASSAASYAFPSRGLSRHEALLQFRKTWRTPPKESGRTTWDLLLVSSGSESGLLGYRVKAKNSVFLAHTYPRGLSSLLTGLVNKYPLARFSQFATVSQFAASRFENLWFLPRGSVKVFPPPIPLNPKRRAVSRVKRPVRVLAVGGLEADKNPLAFVECAHFFRLLAPEMVESFTWVGAGSIEDTVREQIMRRRLSGYVQLVGMLGRDNLGEVYKQNDVLLHLSSRESLGLVPIEAANNGLIVLASSSGGLGDLPFGDGQFFLCDYRQGALIAYELFQVLRQLAGAKDTVRDFPAGQLESTDWVSSFRKLIQPY